MVTKGERNLNVTDIPGAKAKGRNSSTIVQSYDRAAPIRPKQNNYDIINPYTYAG